ncbi:hypothetical protein [Streptomyces sp. NPDC014894]|uniref:hypothetical protein n=1 Tax=Streptomyces sp. NPDC014894 TaxID=3364931 RepID=UPI0036F9CC40
MTSEGGAVRVALVRRASGGELLTRLHDIVIAVLGASVAVVLLVAGAAAALPGSPALTEERAGAVREESAQVVTLVTGDRVRIGTSGGARGEVLEYRPARGRERVPVQIRVHRGRTLAIPEDMRRLIREGRLDRRQFDLGRAAPGGRPRRHRAARAAR